MEHQGEYVVFFDMDKTLLSVNSSVPLIISAYKKGLLRTSSLLKATLLSIIYKLHLGNTRDITKSMALWLKGIPESTVIELSEQLVKVNLIHKIRPSIKKEIEQHMAKGARLVILSASLPYTCFPIARHLKIDDVICSSMEIIDGIFTGKPKGEICIGHEKEIRMQNYCSQFRFKLEEAYCYGDSYSDRFIMEKCGNPVCVNPEGRLRKLADAKKWRLLK